MEQRLHPRNEVNRWSYAKFVRGNPTGARTIENLLQYAGFFAPVSYTEVQGLAASVGPFATFVVVAWPCLDGCNVPAVGLYS